VLTTTASLSTLTQEDAPRPASPPSFTCLKCRRAYGCRFNQWRCKELHQQQPRGAGRVDGGGAAAKESAMVS